MSKPFVKWAGGKTKLLPILRANLPHIFDDEPAITYIEPFVGGGAMLFFMLEKFQNINRVIINDINPALINCYRQIKENHIELIGQLQNIHDEFYRFGDPRDHRDEQRAFYYELRNQYNQIKVEERNTIEAAALFLFFNRTCYNGLYRESYKGSFNVPFGRYVQPKICNAPLIEAAHNSLQNVEIRCGSFQNVMEAVNWNERNFFYFDPPYRPMLGSNNFKQYTKDGFNDPEQENLKNLCDFIHEQGGYLMVSNSDSEIEEGVSYFEQLYTNHYQIERLSATRTINVYSTTTDKKAKEVLIKNY